MPAKGSRSRASARRAAAAAACALLGVGAFPAAAAADGSVSSEAASARAPAGELERSETHVLRGGASVARFQQQVDGVPVLDAEAVVVDPAGQAELAADATRARVEAPPAPQVSRRAATNAAVEAAGIVKVAGRSRSELVIDPEHGDALAWRILVSSNVPPGSFEVLVDARSGELLAVADIALEVTGEAKIFVPNPVVANGGVGGLRDRNDSDSPRLTELREPVTLSGLDARQRCLDGEWAHATLQASDVCRAERDFRPLKRERDGFEAVMAYHHVDVTQRYIQSLGFADPINERSQRVRVNAFPDDNSYYFTGNREIRLGAGGVDDGEDADVITHEYGHAVQGDQAPSFGQTLGGGAVGEGFGDYLAAVMSSQATGGAAAFDACIFDWDSISYSSSGCGRTVTSAAGLDDLPDPCFNEVHCRGEVWSSALWQLRGMLGADSSGRNVIDSDVLASNFMLDADDREPDVARKLILADEILYPTATTDPDGSVHAEHEDEIRAEMQARDILPPPSP